MISSNITTASSGCTVRFIAEDSTLSLAPHTPIVKAQKHKNNDNKITALPSADLVCIMDLGLFEISLRLNDKATTNFPKFDMRASINDFHIRTCSDSCRALAQFLTYVAAEGDFDIADDTESMTSENTSMYGGDNDTDLLTVRTPTSQSAPEVTPLQQERVNSLMADAMEESIRIERTSSEDDDAEEEMTPLQDIGVDVFFFPDETNTALLEQQQKMRTARKSECLSTSMRSESVTSLDSFERANLMRKKSESSSLGDGSGSPMFGDKDSDSYTDLKDLLDFETSEMKLKSAIETEVMEALPQVTKDLGDIRKVKAATPKPTPRKISTDTDDEFCFIAAEEKVSYDRGMNSQQEVPVSVDPIRIIDNHFSVPNSKPDLLRAPEGFPMAVTRYTLCEMSLVWHLFGGHDFLTEEEKAKHSTEKKKPNTRHTPMSEVYKTGVSYSKGSPSVNFGKHESRSWKTRGGIERKHSVLIEIQVNKLRFSHEVYPTNAEQASRQVLVVTEFEVRDRLECSNINKFLYHHGKSKSSNMLVVKLLHIRPNAPLPAQECCIRISASPMRLHVDQDSMEFLLKFFLDIGHDPMMEEKQQRVQVSPPHQEPVMMVGPAQELHARKMFSENLLLLVEEEEEEKVKEPTETASEASDSSPIYFRNIVFGPEVPIRLDYHGKRVEFNHGPLAGLIMGLGQLQCSEIRLKSISYRHGILGVDRLLNFLLQAWLQDIKRNQLQSILVGVGPMHSFVQLFKGIFDLFWLPIEQYQKDGRIVRGLQLGAQSFTARTALAALELTTRIIHLLQVG